MNREQRRSQDRAVRHEERSKLLEMSPSMRKRFEAQTAAIQRISQQGISPKDLEEEYYRGFNDAIKKLAPNTYKVCFSCFLLALHERFGFGTKRCIEIANLVSTKLTDFLNIDEAFEAVDRELKIQLDLEQPVGDVASAKE